MIRVHQPGRPQHTGQRPEILYIRILRLPRDCLSIACYGLIGPTKMAANRSEQAPCLRIVDLVLTPPDKHLIRILIAAFLQALTGCFQVHLSNVKGPAGMRLSDAPRNPIQAMAILLFLFFMLDQ